VPMIQIIDDLWQGLEHSNGEVRLAAHTGEILTGSMYITRLVLCHCQVANPCEPTETPLSAPSR
jgi:hypothetical protein